MFNPLHPNIKIHILHKFPSKGANKLNLSSFQEVLYNYLVDDNFLNSPDLNVCLGVIL